MDYKMNIPPPYQNPTNYTPPQPGYPPLEYGQQPTPPQPMYQPQPSYNGFPPPQQAPFSTPFQQPYNPSGMAQQHPHVPYESGAVGGVGQFQPIGPMKSYQSFCGHITLACFVFWCCGCLCGCIAFILALMASDRASSGRDNEARQLGKASWSTSIFGIISGIIIVIIVVSLNSKAAAPKHMMSTMETCYCQLQYKGAYSTYLCTDCYKGY